MNEKRLKSIVTIENPHLSCVRAVYFNRESDPYVLFHPNADELSNGRLAELYVQWKKANSLPADDEEFEDFLNWLEREKDFSSLCVTDEMYHFNP